MKNVYFRLLLLIGSVSSFAVSLNAQVVCPAVTANSPTLSCSTPCATLTATPSVNLNATNTYAVSSVTYTPFSYTAGTLATFGGAAWSASTDDSYGDLVTLPFNFCFFGNTYSRIVIGTNGNISFNTTGAGSLVNAYDPYSISGPLPGSNCTATENCIMGVWNDTYVGGGNIKYNTYGTAPCRQFVISWNAVDLFLPGTYCDGNTTTSQIVLYESTNIIDIYIGRRAPCAAWNGGLAVCGIENNAGTLFYCPTGENGTTFTATNLGWRFSPTGAVSGWTYNWTAPGGTSVGTTATVVVCPSTTTVYTVTATSAACSGVTVHTTATVTTTGSSTPITGGPLSMCVGGTATFTDATTGGTWSSSNTGVATVTSGVVSGVGGGTSTISYTVAGCTASVVVTVVPYPVISGPTSMCAGSSITLSSSIGGLTWSSSNTGIATVGGTGVVTGISPGVVTIYCPPGGCSSSYTVTVNPVAAITGTPYMCMGYTTTLTSSVTGGTWSSSAGGIAGVSSAGVVSGVSGGTATISYTTSAGCTSTRIVTVNPVAPITGTTALCVGGTTTLNDAVTGGTWFSTNTGVATVGPTTGVVSGVAAGTSIITYTTPAGCTSVTTVNVVILTAITGTNVVCQGSTTTLFDGSGGGIWTSGNTGIATIGVSSGVVSGVSGGIANITYTGGGGCYTTTTVTVNPVSPITGPMSMCQGFSTTLADALTGGTWSSSTPAVATVTSTTGVVSGITAGTSTITYISTFGCRMLAVVTVNPKPAPPVPSPATYCQFAGAIPVSATGTSLLWYGPGVTSGMSVPPIPSTYVAGTINYYVTQTTSFGCVSDSAVDVITIIPQPAPPITKDSSYCQFSPTMPLNFQVDSAPGSNLTWYTVATGGIAIDSVPVPPNTVVTYPSGTTWYVTQTVNGCVSNPSPVKVTIVYLPDFTIRASKNWVCDHDTLTFSYYSTTPLVEGTFQWQLPPGASCTAGTTLTDQSIVVRFDSVYGPHIIYLTVGELNKMCTAIDTISVTVIPPPTAHCYMKPDICLGDTVNLAVVDKSADASLFTWYIDGTLMANSSAVNIVAANSNTGGPFSLSWNDTGIHFITIVCTTNEGCKSVPTYDTIDVHALPNALFTFKPKTTGTLCLEDSVLFMADNVGYNCSFLWQPEHYFNNDNKPQIWGKVDASKSVIMLTVTDPYGCFASSTQEIDPASCCTVLFPNAFTPNGDGKNDRFHPLFDGTSYHRFHSFRIVNRWGQTVFESADNTPSWDGNFNGVPQDIGVYYYYIKYDCGGKTIEQKGDCTLVR